MSAIDSFKCRKTLTVGTKKYVYYSLTAAEKNGLKGISALPYSMKVLLENLLRAEDGTTVKKADIEACAAWLKDKGKARKEIAFRPARVHGLSAGSDASLVTLPPSALNSSGRSRTYCSPSSWKPLTLAYIGSATSVILCLGKRRRTAFV